MSIILKGIDMPATPKAIVIYPNGTIIDGDKKGTKILKAKAIQIPTPHGRLIDKDELLSHIKKDPLFSLVERYGISGVIESRPTILEEEEK